MMRSLPNAIYRMFSRNLQQLASHSPSIKNQAPLNQSLDTINNNCIQPVNLKISWTQNMPFLRSRSKRHQSGTANSETNPHSHNPSHIPSARFLDFKSSYSNHIGSEQEWDSEDLDGQASEYRRKQHLAEGGTNSEFRTMDANTKVSKETRDWQAAQHRRHIAETIREMEREQRPGETEREKRERIIAATDGRN